MLEAKNAILTFIRMYTVVNSNVLELFQMVILVPPELTYLPYDLSSFFKISFSNTTL